MLKLLQESYLETLESYKPSQKKNTEEEVKGGEGQMINTGDKDDSSLKR